MKTENRKSYYFHHVLWLMEILKFVQQKNMMYPGDSLAKVKSCWLKFSLLGFLWHLGATDYIISGQYLPNLTCLNYSWIMLHFRLHLCVYIQIEM